MRAALLIALLFLCSCISFAEQARPGDSLLAFVKSTQVANIKASTAPDAQNCFTDDDYIQFEKQGRAAAIAKTALSSTKGKQVLADVRAIPAAERAKIFEAARNIARPTWAQLGDIPADGSGQTDAGNRAERILAGELIDQIEKALKK
jgi:hypothetical protein